MDYKRIFLIVIALFFAVRGNAWATHATVGSGYGHTGPITTVSAATLQRGQVVIELQTEFLKFDRFSGNRLLEFAQEDKEIHNVDYLQIYSLGISYGIADDITVHARIPYVYRNDIQESEPPDEVHDHGDAKGIGDAAIHVHQRFIKIDNPNFEASLLAGLKIPTGKTSDKDIEGRKFEAEFQPGSGSWDPSLGVAVTKRADALSLDANLLYTLVTEGTQDTDLGDFFNYNVALCYQTIQKPVLLDLIIEANGIWRQKEEVDGKKDENSGGNIVFISPGIRCTVKDRLAAYLSLGLPVLQDLNGKQNDVSYRFLFGMSLVF